MGFSVISTHLLFFIAVVGLSAGVLAVFSDYLGQTMGAMGDKQQHITSQLKTDIKITNIDNSSGHLNIYVKNVGKEKLLTSCVELYADSQWVTLTPSRITDPATGSQVDVWLPEATLKLSPASAQLNSGATHEAKIVTCNGVSDTEDF